MRTHTRTRTQYGLDGDSGQHWSANAACRDDPNAFTAPDSYHGQWRPKQALHICRVHCEVRAECAEHAAGTGDRAGMILGGVAYDSHGRPSQYGNAATASCARCRAAGKQPADEPSTHGTVAASRWHHENGMPLCRICRKGEERREVIRLANRARAAERARLAEVS